jgi:hypothetical protein
MTIDFRLDNLQADAINIHREMNDPDTDQTVENWVPAIIESVQMYLFDGIIDSRDIHEVIGNEQQVRCTVATLCASIDKAHRMYSRGMWSEQEVKLHILTQALHLLQHTDALQHLRA